ncbi:MAG: BMP family ABC transporter substrate-binding protein [Mycoplasmoidaceae bacterium]|nr:BMP family ABC transporter substrate-binding protein [Mycoplasmoidaceae bacterium]
MVIDGATHTTMDRSFNQSLYEGLVDFNKNIQCKSYSPQNMEPRKNNTAMSLKPSQDNTTEFINTYMSIIDDERNGVVGLAGFNHSTPLNALMFHNKDEDGIYEAYATANSQAAIERTGKTGFILLDANCANNQNVASVQFRADQPGFLAALAVGEYLYNNLDIYHNEFQDLSVAEFGGVSIPTVMIYMGGFQRGIEFFNVKVLQSALSRGSYYYLKSTEPSPEDALRERRCYKTFIELVKHSKYQDEINELRDNTSLTDEEKLAKFAEEIQPKVYEEYSIKIIKLGDIGTHFTGTFAAGDAIGITKQYLNRGASAIIAVAGPQSLDAAQEIQNQNSKCILVGVDSAMENGDYQRFHKGCSIDNKKVHNTNDPYIDKSVADDGSTPTEANSIIKFSAVKDIKAVSNKISRLIAQG